MHRRHEWEAVLFYGHHVFTKNQGIYKDIAFLSEVDFIERIWARGFFSKSLLMLQIRSFTKRSNMFQGIERNRLIMYHLYLNESIVEILSSIFFPKQG